MVSLPELTRWLVRRFRHAPVTVKKTAPPRAGYVIVDFVFAVSVPIAYIEMMPNSRFPKRMRRHKLRAGVFRLPTEPRLVRLPFLFYPKF